MIRIVLAFLILIGALSGSTTDSHGQVIPQAYYRMGQAESNNALGLRFRSGANPYLSRVPTAVGNQSKFTISAWVKFGNLSTGNQPIFTQFTGLSGSWGIALYVNNSGQVNGIIDTWTGSSGTAASWTSVPVLRDSSAWYHIVGYFDTTQAAAADRFKAFVNGVPIALTVGTVYGSFPQNFATVFGNTSYAMRVGAVTTTGSNNTSLDGYMADVAVVDGQALPGTAFGEFDAEGMWVPKTYVGSYGTNGFRLDFADTSAATSATLGKDRAGSNDYTPNNISVTAGTTYDPVLDAPRVANNGGNGIGSYATWNPNNRTPGSVTVANANLSVSNSSSASNWPGMGGTMAVSSGKWYYEFTYSGVGSLTSSLVGVAETDIVMTSDVTTQNAKYGGWLLRNDSAGLGEAYANFGSSASYASGADAPASGTVMVALDMDNNKFWLGRGGTWLGGGNPSTNTGGHSFAAGKTLMPFTSPCCLTGGGGFSYFTNFGQRAYDYTPPTGFKAWNTYNLPTPVIKDPSPYIKIATYTGNGAYVSVGEPVKLAGTKQIANSLRFKSASSTYLSRPLTAVSSQTKATFSGWVKRTKLGARQTIFSTKVASLALNAVNVEFSSADNLQVTLASTADTNYSNTSTAFFRDPSMWYHVVVSIDTTQAAAADRLRVYVNGTQVTLWSATNIPPQNTLIRLGDGVHPHSLGVDPRDGTYFDGYMADVYFIDGTALTAASFGELDANNNWAPKAVTGVTYGSNGFRLDFSTPVVSNPGSYIGSDLSGNNNNFMSWNMSSPNVASFVTAGSGYLNRTVATTGNQKVWTWSGWVRRTRTGNVYDYIFAGGSDGNGNDGIAALYFENDKLTTYFDSPTTNPVTATTATFTDANWHHIVWKVNVGSTLSQIYVDNVLVQTASPPDFTYEMNQATMPMAMGRQSWAGSNYATYMLANVDYVDGQALNPSAFAETVSSTWTPKAYTGTYGTNGFKMTFANRSSLSVLGTDTSGNGNNFTATSLTSALTYNDDVTRESPTPYNDGTYDHGNWAIWNPLASLNSAASYLSMGGLSLQDASNSGGWRTAYATLAARNGKYYWETTIPSVGSSVGNSYGIGTLANASNLPSTAYGFYWNSAGLSKSSPAGTVSIGGAPVAGDVLMIAYDANIGSLWIGKNGVWFDGNPATGATPTYSGITIDAYPFQSTFSNNAGGGGLSGSITNFGQIPYAYAVPAGYKSLSTNNITAAAGFIPDLVFTKNRSAAVGWGWYDRVRGATLELDSSSTAGNTASSTGLLNFQNGGFTAGSSSKFNTSGQNYVSYMFKEGTTPGFDIVSYTGNNAVRTLAHNLGAAPKLMIVKNTSVSSCGGDGQSWFVYHASNGAGYQQILEGDQAKLASIEYWNNTDPTSSVFTLGSGNRTNCNNNPYIAYLFAEVPGFSKIGSYTGNGSVDGPYIHTGFKPAFVMWKRTDAAAGWELLDSARDINNVTGKVLYMNANAAEVISGAGEADFTANGFKIRDNSGRNNASGGNYIYIAFAERPFKFTNAR